MTRVLQPYKGKYPRPKNLGSEAYRMWDSISGTFDLRPDEYRILVDICREIDIVNRIERELQKAPTMVVGSNRQEVANPLFAEARQHRLTLATLFGKLKLTGRKANGEKSDGQKRADNVVSMASKWREAK